ncbi:MAG: hypothetical protein V7709_12825 [Halioglobus sp.]
MKIKQIVFALLFMGSQSALAQVAAGSAIDIHKLTIDASLDTSVTAPVEKIQDQNQLENEAEKEITRKHAALPTTIDEVASGLQFKLDQRMETNFDHRNTWHPEFAIAY